MSIQSTPEEYERRLWSRIAAGDLRECWPWLGYVNANGYPGRITWGQIDEAPYRRAYRLVHGDIPQGFQLDHLCRNKVCCNPLHLQAVSCLVNVRRGTCPSTLLARANTCVRGHEFTPDNTTWRRSPDRARRVCRICMGNRAAETKEHRLSVARAWYHLNKERVLAERHARHPLKRKPK